jgi:hypothetical protein
MGAMPEIDWKALAREEEREIRAAGSLNTAKWLGIAKAIVIAAALIGVAVVVYNLVWNVEGQRPQPVAKKPVRTDPTEADRRAMQDRFDRIATYEKVYAATCDRTTRNQLVAMLREAEQVTRANTLETTQCVPVRPSCDDVKATIGARLRESFHLLEDKSWTMACQGILMLRGAGVEPGLVVVLSAHDTNNRIQTLRGVASIDGARDLVSFGGAPGTRLAGIGDLDGDSSEELVFVDTTSLTVSSIKGPGFVDVVGPSLASGCAADVNIEGDFRDGRKGEKKYVVLTVPDGVKKQCPKPGRHFYALRDGELSETD